MRLSLFFFTMCMLTYSLDAQVAWQKSYKISDPGAFTVIESAHTMVQTPDGSYLVGGTFSMANEARVAYMMKIGANGDSLWTKQYPYAGRLAKLYYDNNGDLRGIFDVAASGQGTTLYFTKLDAANGDTISSFKAPKPVAADVYRYSAHVQLPDNSYLVTALGSTAGGHFLRFTPGSTTATWYADSLANLNMAFGDMILDGTSAVVTGWSGSPLNFTVAKYNIADGKTQWRRKMLYENGGCCDSRGRGIVKNSQGNYVAGGEWRAKINSIINIVPGFFVVSPNGDSLSSTTILEDGDVKKMVKWNNNIIAIGKAGKDDKDPAGQDQHHTDITIFVLGDDGQVLNTTTRFNNATIVPSGSSYLPSHWSGAGLYVNTASELIAFGQGAHTPPAGTGSGTDQNTFITKFAPGTTGVSATQSVLQRISVFPNPATEKLFVDMGITSGNMIITNIYGQQVWQRSVSGTITVPVSGWASGTYFISLRNGNAVQTARFIKN